MGSTRRNQLALLIGFTSIVVGAARVAAQSYQPAPLSCKGAVGPVLSPQIVTLYWGKHSNTDWVRGTGYLSSW